MAKHDVSMIRNFSIVAHGGAGKTSLVEAILYSAGAVACCDWNACRVNIIDTPVFINFIEDARGCLRVSDGASFEGIVDIVKMKAYRFADWGDKRD